MNDEKVIINIEQWNEYQDLLKRESEKPHISILKTVYSSMSKEIYSQEERRYNIPEEISKMIEDYKEPEIFELKNKNETLINKVKILEKKIDKIKELKEKGLFKFYFNFEKEIIL